MPKYEDFIKASDLADLIVSPSIKIGTVTTGGAGSNANANITGIHPNYTLNLTIPRGNTGATGPSGVTSWGAQPNNVSSSNPAVVIKSYYDSNNWYRIFSDGFKEQGGFFRQTQNIQTISFVYPFSSIVLNIHMTSCITANHDGYGSNPELNGMPTLYSFSCHGIFNNGINLGFYWTACGF